MKIIILTVIIVTGITNIIADLLFSSGKDYSNKDEKPLEAIRRTPEKHFFISAIMGMISILCWEFPLYYISKIPGNPGIIASISFAMLIGSIAVFHVVCCLSMTVYKFDESKEYLMKKHLFAFGPACVAISLVYTITMIYLGATGGLTMYWYHYLTLPLPSNIIIQFVLSKILSRVPYYSSISGTISMIVALLSTVNVMIISGF